jgi:hypothetical protein
MSLLLGVIEHYEQQSQDMVRELLALAERHEADPMYIRLSTAERARQLAGEHGRAGGRIEDLQAAGNER